jgi:preprotein translocase subunit SecD
LSIQAGVLGFLAIAVFMMFCYRLPGILAVLALLFYVAIVLAIFKLIPVTVTIAGITGFILSVGMAVDANILIFERLREELKAGKRLEEATGEGFGRAWTSIRDSNVSSLITCSILYWLGTSVVQGFALTLFIGILVSMFSAIWMTRTLLRAVITGGMQSKRFLFTSPFA